MSRFLTGNHERRLTSLSKPANTHWPSHSHSSMVFFPNLISSILVSSVFPTPPVGFRLMTSSRSHQTLTGLPLSFLYGIFFPNLLSSVFPTPLRGLWLMTRSSCVISRKKIAHSVKVWLEFISKYFPIVTNKKHLPLSFLDGIFVVFPTLPTGFRLMTRSSYVTSRQKLSQYVKVRLKFIFKYYPIVN